MEEDEHPEIPTNVYVITSFADIIDGVAPRDTLVGMWIGEFASMDSIIVCEE